MKKVLIIGRSNHSLLSSLYKRLAEDQELEGKVSFDFLSLNGTEKSTGVYARVMDGSRTALCGPVLSKIPKIGTFVYFRRLRAMFAEILDDYSVVHFQFGFGFLHVLTRVLLNFKGTKVLTFWGSDVYRISASAQQKNRAFYQSMDFFTFANPDMKKKFYQATKIQPKKDLDIRFGLDLLDLKLKDPDFKRSEDQLTLYLGTNGSKGQQHLKLIDALKTLPDAILNRLTFIVPFNYGVDSPEYQQEVQKQMQTLTTNFRLITDYYQGPELITFRKNCDLLIQTQVTDAFSGAMQEHLFFGSVLITGAWLPYQLMKDSGVYFHQVNDFSEISAVVTQCVQQIRQERLKGIHNDQGLYQLSSWEANLHKWKRSYG